MCEFYGHAQEKSVVYYLVAEPFNSAASSGLTTLALASSGMKINRGPGSSVGIATGCWTVRILNPGGE
jgi:acyl dehydratase